MPQFDEACIFRLAPLAQMTSLLTLAVIFIAVWLFAEGSVNYHDKDMARIKQKYDSDMAEIDARIAKLKQDYSALVAENNARDTDTTAPDGIYARNAQTVAEGVLAQMRQWHLQGQRNKLTTLRDEMRFKLEFNGKYDGGRLEQMIQKRVRAEEKSADVTITGVTVIAGVLEVSVSFELMILPGRS